MRVTKEKVLKISRRSLPLEPPPTVLKTGLLHWVMFQVAKVSFSPEWNQTGPRHLKMFLWANIKCVHISQSWSKLTFTIILTLQIKQLLSVVMCCPRLLLSTLQHKHFHYKCWCVREVVNISKHWPNSI